MFRLPHNAVPAFLVNLDPVPEPDPGFWWPKIEMGPELLLFTNSDLAGINKVKKTPWPFKDYARKGTGTVYDNESIENLVQANLCVVPGTP